MKLYLPLLVLPVFAARGICVPSCDPKIAIIGGGIGGASTSHFLGQLFNNNLGIDLYEAKTIGGRLATVQVDKHQYESGGSVIHSRNKYMQDFVKLLGLEHRPDSNEKAGIWNGKEFVFVESDWEILTLTKLLYRYGLHILKLERHISSILNDFEKIYQLQDSGKSFENVTALLSAMNIDFPKLLQIPATDYLLSLGYRKELIDEIVQSAMVVNYGQDTNIQSFVTCVSLAAVTGNLWSVRGGNKKVPEHLIYRNSNVNIVPSYVRKIVNLPPNGSRSLYEVHYSNKDSPNVMKSVYDIVILATPLTQDHEFPIMFEGFPNNDFTVPGKYHTTVATFVKADLNSHYFGLQDNIDSILSCNPNSTVVNSVGRLCSVEGSTNNGRNVWKIFSGTPLKPEFMQKMFFNIEDTEEIIWKAYPEYTTNSRHDKFKLHDGLYHVNAIEWAASAMEMSAIGGRNVALLVHEDFLKKCDKQYVETMSTESGTDTTPSSEL